MLDTSMMSLLPASEQQPIVKTAAEQMGGAFSKRLIILVSSEDKQARQQAVKQVVEKLSPIEQVESVIWQLDGLAIQQSQQALFDYRYALLTDSLVDAIDADETGRIREQALGRILNPMGMSSTRLVDDPFGLMATWLEQKSVDISIVPKDGFLGLVRADNTYLVVVNLAADAFSMNTQQAVLSAYQPLIPELADTGVTLESAGLIIHADAGARQAKQEMSTIGLGSLIGIIVLMFWVFRGFNIVGLMILPVVVGCFVATSIAFMIFDRVHIVTFAFGAGLIGVAIDYALHYLCERQVQDSVLKRILPGLLLGLLSSVLAYLALAITPFPGLRQMALFSVAGLIAAWLTVVLWLPLLTRNIQADSFHAAEKLANWQAKLPNLERYPRTIGLSLLLVTLLAVYLIVQGKTEDDIRLLQTSPPSLIAQEQRVQNLLGVHSGTAFMLIPCTALDDCLKKEQALKPTLKQLKQQGRINRYRLVSDEVPALSEQDANVARVTTLYENELNGLLSQLGLPESITQQAMASLAADSEKRLVPEQLNQALFNPTAGLIINSEQYGIATVVSFSSPKKLNGDELALLQQAVPDIILVDQVDAISSLMANHREQLLVWVSLAYLCVFVILAWRYKQTVWRILLPPLLASTYTLSILMSLLPGINLFHLMALILVLGIGVDMGIFLTETRHAAQTWLAVTLSALTSLLAFGLLALSYTPILMHFGLTVLFGLTFVWILSTLLRQTPEQGGHVETR
ncbi:hypothetical protein OMP94_02115 [Methylophaga sp. OBS3]|nr:hypothetical protein [Methylophaga sp. OBS3]